MEKISSAEAPLPVLTQSPLNSGVRVSAGVQSLDGDFWYWTSPSTVRNCASFSTPRFSAERGAAERLRFDGRAFGLGVLAAAEQGAGFVELVLGAIEIAAMAGKVFRCRERIQRLPGLGDRGLGGTARVPLLIAEVPPAGRRRG